MMKDTEALDIYVPKAVPPATDVRTGLVRSGFWAAMRLSTYRSGERICGCGATEMDAVGGYVPTSSLSMLPGSRAFRTRMMHDGCFRQLFVSARAAHRHNTCGVMFRDSFPLCSTPTFSFDVVFPMFSCSYLFCNWRVCNLYSYQDPEAARNTGNIGRISWPAATFADSLRISKVRSAPCEAPLPGARRATPVYPYNLRHRRVVPLDTHAVASMLSRFATEPATPLEAAAALKRVANRVSISDRCPAQISMPGSI